MISSSYYALEVITFQTDNCDISIILAFILTFWKGQVKNHVVSKWSPGRMRNRNKFHFDYF